MPNLPKTCRYNKTDDGARQKLFVLLRSFKLYDFCQVSLVKQLNKLNT